MWFEKNCHFGSFLFIEQQMCAVDCVQFAVDTTHGASHRTSNVFVCVRDFVAFLFLFLFS